jgi:hypothetical protein
MTNPTLTFMCPEPNRVKGEGGGYRNSGFPKRRIEPIIVFSL